LSIIPFALVIGVFLLVVLVKRPWRVLGGLFLAFFVFVFVGLAIPRFQAGRHNPFFQHTEQPRHFGQRTDGSVVMHSSEHSHRESEFDGIPNSSAIQGAVAVSGDEHGQHGEHGQGAAASPSASAAAPKPEAAAEPEMPADAVVVQKAPDWIKADTYLDPKTNTYVQVVHTGTATSPFELNRKLDQEIQAVTAEYLAYVFGPAASNMQVPIDYLREKVVKQQHTETVRRQFNGPAGFDDPGTVTHVQETWARLEFDPEARRDLAIMWDQEVAQRRLWQAGGLGALIMGVLASAVGYLRLDTATKGYYTRTLRWGAGLVILGLVVAGLTLVG
jgi:hypothetical protein